MKLKKLDVIIEGLQNQLMMEVFLIFYLDENMFFQLQDKQNITYILFEFHVFLKFDLASKYNILIDAYVESLH